MTDGAIAGMKIIICDSNEKDRALCENRVRAIAEKAGVPAALVSCSTGAQAIFDISDKKDADLIYIDVSLTDSNGLELARRLRAMDVKADIVFFTREKPPVFQAFDVEAMHYLIKDEVTDKKFEEVFLRAKRRSEKRSEETMLFSCAGEHVRVAISDILYFEVRNRIITVHYGDRTFEFYSTLAKIEELLCGRGFIRTHKAFLVAEKYIWEVFQDTIRLSNGELLPIGGRFAGNIPVRNEGRKIS